MSSSPPQPITLPVTSLLYATTLYARALAPLGYTILPTSTPATTTNIGMPTTARTDIILSQSPPSHDADTSNIDNTQPLQQPQKKKKPHIIFPAMTLQEVYEFYENAMEAGGDDGFEPRENRGEWEAGVRDMDGNWLEVRCAVVDDGKGENEEEKEERKEEKVDGCDYDQDQDRTQGRKENRIELWRRNVADHNAALNSSDVSDNDTKGEKKAPYHTRPRRTSHSSSSTGNSNSNNNKPDHPRSHRNQETHTRTRTRNLTPSPSESASTSTSRTTSPSRSPHSLKFTYKNHTITHTFSRHNKKDNAQDHDNDNDNDKGLEGTHHNTRRLHRRSSSQGDRDSTSASGHRRISGTDIKTAVIGATAALALTYIFKKEPSTSLPSSSSPFPPSSHPNNLNGFDETPRSREPHKQSQSQRQPLRSRQRMKQRPSRRRYTLNDYSTYDGVGGRRAEAAGWRSGTQGYVRDSVAREKGEGEEDEARYMYRARTYPMRGGDGAGSW